MLIYFVLPVLSWIWTSVSDYRISTAFPFITKLLGEFFHCQEILDNPVRTPSFLAPHKEPDLVGL